MRINRRTLILGAAAMLTAAAAAPGLMTTRRAFRRILAQNFAPDIVAHPETDRFLDSLIARLDWPEGVAERVFWVRQFTGLSNIDPSQIDALVLTAFVKETTVVRAEEVGADMLFLGVANPLENPCNNPLSSMWL